MMPFGAYAYILEFSLSLGLYKGQVESVRLDHPIVPAIEQEV